MPKISIIIPSYNHAKLLPTAIKSILNQEYSNWELIIVDDGSIDNTKEVVENFKDTRIKYFYQKNSGVASAMNTGFNLASGTLFAWLDADNYYDINTFKEIDLLSNQFPQIDIFYGNVAIMNGDKFVKLFVPQKIMTYKNVLLYTAGAVPVQPGVFFKRHLFENVKGFNMRYKIAGDIDFWVKVLKTSPSYMYVDKTFGYYLQDDKAISQGLKGIRNGFKEMVSIFNEHNQPLHGRFLMIKKYTIGYIRTIIKSIIK